MHKSAPEVYFCTSPTQQKCFSALHHHTRRHQCIYDLHLPTISVFLDWTIILEVYFCTAPSYHKTVLYFCTAPSHQKFISALHCKMSAGEISPPSEPVAAMYRCTLLQHCTIKCSAVQCCWVQCSAVHYNTVFRHCWCIPPALSHTVWGSLKTALQGGMSGPYILQSGLHILQSGLCCW